MYKQVETYPEIFMESACIVAPLVTLKDEYGGIYHIIEDDHCYVLCREQKDSSCRPVAHIFPEAFELLKKLPTLV